MSADLMIICKEDDSGFDGKGSDKAFFIDETSMGDPWSEFGKWFGQRYCRAPGILEQVHGFKDHSHIELTKSDYAAIEHAVNTMVTHEGLDKDLFLKYIEEHIGKHISTECW